METVEQILARLAEELEAANTPEHKRKVQEHISRFQLVRKIRASKQTQAAKDPARP